MRGRPNTPTILKLIRGTDRPGTLRDDVPQVDAPPRLPPGVILSPDERAMWDWLLENLYLPGVHGAGDGPIFVKCARLWCRALAADQKIEQHGAVMKGAQGKPMAQPYVKISRDAWTALGTALVEIGGSPVSRVKLAAPRSALASGDAASWSEID
jgi:P27 family predicted phage terminase small subunit